MKIKRIYEDPAPDDGYRMLVDRILIKFYVSAISYSKQNQYLCGLKN